MYPLLYHATSLIYNKKIFIALVANNHLQSITLRGLLHTRSKETKSLSLEINLFSDKETALAWLNKKNNLASSAQ